MEQVHVLCLALEGSRLSKPHGPQYLAHAVLEFLALSKALGASPQELHGAALTGCGVRTVGTGRLMQPCDAVALTERLVSGPVAVGGLSLAQGAAMGARLIGLDLCIFIQAGPTVDALLSQMPPPPAAWRIRASSTTAPPYHLLMYAWGSKPSGKTKRQSLEKVEASGLPNRLGCGKRIKNISRCKLYHALEPEPAEQFGSKTEQPEPERHPELLSLLMVHDPEKRGPYGELGALVNCLLVAEAGGGAGLCGPRGLFASMQRYHVSARPHHGLTAIKPELAFIMSNLAGLTDDSPLILDPYAGTGSLLLPAAHLSCYPCGADIELGATDVIIGSKQGGRGAGAPGTGVVANFRHLGLTPPELIQGDIFSPVWASRCAGVFDAIVADPPYGLRTFRQVDSTKDAAGQSQRAQRAEISLRYLCDFTGDQMLAMVKKMVTPLLQLAARVLKTGGRLVYIFPTFSSQAGTVYWDAEAFGGAVHLEASHLPAMNGLRFESSSHEPCVSRTIARNVVVMVKDDGQA
jgi:tRNA G10  N-methylase Trm11